MTDQTDDHDGTARMVRAHYNPPPGTPREEIWTVLEARIRKEVPDRDAGGALNPPDVGGGTPVIPLPRGGAEADGGVRRRRPSPWRMAWMAAAATVVLATGIGVGRWSRSPTPVVEQHAAAGAPEEGGLRRAATASRLAATEHLSRTEPLLALVKADVARGSVDPSVEAWAQDLLGQTRFLLDSGLPLDPEVVALLEDLEMVLLQTALVAGGGVEGDRAHQELSLIHI